MISEALMRTLVDIPQTERTWLDKKAKEQGVSMAEALRRAVRAAHESEKKHDNFIRLMDKIQGTWTKGDGLAWQKKMRAEWAR
jgi:Arc/MetJ-type ribon-helix-helix transcriptional regulator